MKPYFSDACTTLYLGDCLDVLSRLAANSVDLIFADPPYNLSNGGFTCHAGRMVPVHKGEWDKSKGIDVDFEFTCEWLSACKRVLKRTGTIWVSGTQHVIFLVGFAMQKLGFHLLNTVTWYKPNAPPNLSCRYFTHSNELLIWASPARGKKLQHTFHYDEMRRRNDGRQMRDVWILGAPLADEKVYGKHPTQKPLELLNRIISASSDRGSLVLDPFNGSGTTGVMAVALGRKYIGIDTEKNFLEVTKKRLVDLNRSRRQTAFFQDIDKPSITAERGSNAETVELPL